jgi:light-regulated signal transduction histidine kinase (bacteriophytochrome)
MDIKSFQVNPLAEVSCNQANSQSIQMEQIQQANNNEEEKKDKHIQQSSRKMNEEETNDEYKNSAASINQSTNDGNVLIHIPSHHDQQDQTINNEIPPTQSAVNNNSSSSSAPSSALTDQVFSLSSSHSHSAPTPSNLPISSILGTALIRIAVQDTGSGVSIEHQNNLFQAYMQIEAGKNQKGLGSGLGLCISVSDKQHLYVL